MGETTSSEGRGPGADLTGAMREAILAAEFAPHQRLIESDLVDRFAASRAAVRTALLNLAGEGLVERLPNRGARVRAITVAEAVEIVEARIGLETLCAAKAARKRSPAQADRLRSLRAGIVAAAAGGDLMTYSRLHQELDDVVREASGHAVAAQLLERLRAQSARHQFRLSFQPGRIARSAPEHLAIIDAVLEGDAARAEEATRAHLTGVMETLRALD